VVQAITEGMTRSSYFLHDTPIVGRGPLPDRQRLSVDLESLRVFEASTRG
jgi:hypothetical protein